MKSQILTTLTALASAGFALGQATTTPVGYTTQTLAANTFNVVGLNVHTSPLVTGAFTAVSGADLTDTNVNFTTALPAGKMCILEITSGTTTPLVIGTVQEFVTWSGSTITTPTAITGVAVGNTYTVRVAPTLQEIFPVGFLAGSVIASTADKVWVPSGAGVYTKYWYKTTAPIGWHTTTTGSDDGGLVSGDIPLVYIDSILVEKKSVTKDLVITGEIKKTGSNVLITPGFNLISTVSPVGLTLFTAGLSGDIAGSVIASTADKIWVPTGTGTYTKYWYKTSAPIGWRTTSTGSDDTGAVSVDVNLPSGFLIQKMSGSKVVSIDVPTSYSSL